ncbi:MAG: tetratricopeptide repeat protein, partial [Candidatus Hodarchaeales archaeon]
MLYRFDELNHIEQLIFQGSLKKALNRVKKLENLPNLKEEEQFECQLLTVDALIQLGNVKEALSKITRILRTDISIRITSHALALKCEALFRLGKHDDSLDAASQLEAEISRLKKVAQIEGDFIIYMKGGLLLIRSGNFLFKGDIDRALDLARQSKQLFKQLGLNFRIAQIDNAIGMVYQSKGDFSQAMNYYQQSLERCKEYGYRFYVLIALGNISEIYMKKGDLIQALNHYQNQLIQLTQFEETHSETYLPGALERIGYIYSQLGDLDQALKYLQKSHDIYKESQYQSSHTPLASS